MESGRVLTLVGVHHARHQVSIRFAIDGLSFSTSLWYGELDLDALGRTYGADTLRRLLFHIAVFELNKLCSLRPERVDLGDYRDLWTPALESLWRAVFVHVWAQWRYENDDPHYRGPTFNGLRSGPQVVPQAVPQVVPQAVPQAVPQGPTRPQASTRAETLMFCGGGKDSLVGMRLLERAGVDYDVLVYASSIYGPAAAQHRLIDGLVERCRPGRRLQQWVFDDFLDSPVLALRPELGVTTLTAAETPSSVFAALPLALGLGYSSFALGHERSADQGQLVWERTGESVNHQWGKSLAAERLLSAYIREHLIEGFTYYSLLKPIHDLVIFSALRGELDALPLTHSCNLRKPWCLSCPKCLYVWLGCAAFVPRSSVMELFGADDLLDRAALVPGFRALMGLDGRQPFECIGGAEEVRVLLGLCERRGYEGRTLDLFRAEVGGYAAVMPLARAYLDVDLLNTAIPTAIRGRVEPELRAAASSAEAFIRATFAGDDPPRR